jgi:hypothetical protein
MDAFFGINLFFISLSVVVFLGVLFLILALIYAVLETIYSSIKWKINQHYLNKRFDEVINQIQKNIDKESKKVV